MMSAQFTNTHTYPHNHTNTHTLLEIQKIVTLYSIQVEKKYIDDEIYIYIYIIIRCEYVIKYNGLFPKIRLNI